MDTAKNLIERNQFVAEHVANTIDDRDSIAASAAHEASCYAFLTAAYECIDFALVFSDEGNERVIHEIQSRLEVILKDFEREHQ